MANAMKEALAFCLSMILGGVLLGELRFGGMRSGRPADSKSAGAMRTADRKSPDPDGPPPPEELGAGGPDAGKPAPLQPRPGHHLAAANALPPGDHVYLLPKD